jgi:hypothetical protein
MLQDKRAKFKVNFHRFYSKIQITIGIFLIILIGYTIISGIKNDNLLEDKELLLTLLIFLLLSSLPFVLGVKKNILLKQFRTYLPRLLYDKTHSIDQLAKDLDLSEDSVKKQLLKMIHKGYFTNAYINRDTNCIIFAGEDNRNMETFNTYVGSNNKVDEVLSSKYSNEELSQGTYRTVICNNCGTANKIKVGAANACDFCGSIIKS